MQVEYKAIVDVGLVLQIDDPSLPDNWDMINLPSAKLATSTEGAALAESCSRDRLEGGLRREAKHQSHPHHTCG
jgi:hypothetical protein